MKTNRLREYLDTLQTNDVQEVLLAERCYVKVLLEEYSGNYHNSARAAGMKMSTLARLARIHGLHIGQYDKLAILNRERARERAELMVTPRTSPEEIARAKEKLIAKGLGFLLEED